MVIKKQDLSRRKRSKTLIDNQVITDTYTSTSIRTEDFRTFVLYLDIDSTGQPTDTVFNIQFSEDNVYWYNLTEWQYGDLRYEDTATANRVRESMGHINILGRYIRLLATVTGGDGTNYFTVTAKMEFYN